MARIRSVKPEFWTDPDVVALSMPARLLFIGSWNHADDYGVLRDDPMRLKLQVLPADDVDAAALIDEIVAAGLLLRRTAPDGTNVLVIRTFCVHQKIDKRAVGRWGHPDDFQPPPTDPNQSPPIPTDPAPGLEGTGLDWTSNTPSSADADGATDTFDEWWSAYPKKVGKKAARRAYLRALKDTGADVLLTAMTARADLWRRDGTARQFIPDPATWLNQGRWDDELDQPAPVTELRPDAMLVRNQRRQSGEACPECADAGLILDGDGLAWPCLTCQREDAG